MKIIHCGDIHLDSTMKTNLTNEQAIERKNEILLTFTRMVAYAEENEISVIMIAGDLFDTKNVSVKTKNVVKDCILSHPAIDFLYLKGNHDASSFLNELDVIPEHLKMFSDTWTSYRYDDVLISGVELDERNSNTIYQTLMLNPSDKNIVMMHGQESQYAGRDKTETIHLTALKNKNVDYLALGHIHTYKEGALDNRGIYCYCGCLEGRGYDECGPKGFVVLDTTNGKIAHEFLPFSRRIIREVEVIVTGLMTTNQVDEAIAITAGQYSEDDLLKVILVGEVSVESERNLSFLTKKYADKFYAFKIVDQTKLAIKMEDYRYDATLKGEFIRFVLEQSFSEQDRKEVIETGLKALAGEELEA